MSIRSRRKRNKAGRVHHAEPGTSPGTVSVDPQAPKPHIRIMSYGPDSLIEQTIEDPKMISQLLAQRPVTWINVDGLGDADILRQLGDVFSVHRLAMEDVVNVHQRAKVEQYHNHYFIVAPMPEIHERLETDQLSMFLGRNYVLTFQEYAGDCFESVRARIRKTAGQIRGAGPDYLAYALLDAVIDSYFPVLEHYGESIESLEAEVILQPDRDVVSRIQEIKRDLMSLRRIIWPLREAMAGLTRESTTLITADTRIYLRDCYDHTIQIIDLLENFRDVAGSLMEVYLSSISNRMNEVMKVLTIFTTIFIPLSFIAGVFGMNFDRTGRPWNMPELGWRYGYFYSLGLMAAMALGMLIYFRRRGWFGSTTRRRR